MGEEDEDAPEDAPEEPEEGEAEEGEFVSEDPEEEEGADEDEAEELDLDDEEALLLFELSPVEEEEEDWEVEGEGEEVWPHPASIRATAVHPKMEATTSNIFFFFKISLQCDPLIFL